ncbi:MAG: amidohydrolase, partial [Dethiosulfovibrio peptidovorans]
MAEDNSMNTLLNRLKEISPVAERLALDLWNNPELGLEERYAADRYEEILSREGFNVQRGIGDLDTAISAKWGYGSPCIGFLGEYDALPGMTKDGGPGHGCGHNLLGAASLGAAMVLKRHMEDLKLRGTVVFYGCPAEENNGGKVYMARDGCFSELDAALTWHPADVNAVWEAGTLALNACNFIFKGLTSHAAKSPEAGRSALDGAILMDVGVNYLREHMIQEARIHSVISSGGKTPNVVPAEATICYYVRAPRRDQVEPLFERVINCAKGAALMTGTSFEIDMIDGLYNYLSNPVLNGIASEIMAKLGGPDFDEEDRKKAATLQSSLPEKTVQEVLRNYGTTADVLGQPLSDVYLAGGGPMAKGKT